MTKKGRKNPMPYDLGFLVDSARGIPRRPKPYRSHRTLHSLGALHCAKTSVEKQIRFSYHNELQMFRSYAGRGNTDYMPLVSHPCFWVCVRSILVPRAGFRT